MLSTLRIKNVKCFADAKFNFSPITVFCGANSAGKSTALQCLLLLRQSFNSSMLSRKALGLVGEYFSVGHARDLISHVPYGENLVIGLDDLEFSCDLKSINLDAYHLEMNELPTLAHSLFVYDFNYLSAYRLSPQNSYDVNCDTNKFDVGIYGQFAVAELVRYGSRPARNQRLARKVCSKLKLDEDREVSLEIAFKEAMKMISPDFDIVLGDYSDMDKVSNSFSSQGTSEAVRPVNTGFGISYVLPIIVAALSTSESGYLLVENPEVHLHPSAQSILAGFLTMAATCGIQVVLETHSDHILNGIRVYVKENKVEDGYVTINSVRSTKQGRAVTEILVDQDGGLSDMDDGFFDQAEKDLLRLF